MYRTAGLSLAHRRTGERVAVRRNVFDPQGDNIAASQLAIDGEVEHRQVARSPYETPELCKVPDLQCIMAAADVRLSESRGCSTLRPCCIASGTQAPQPVTLQTTGQEQGRAANNRRGTGSL